MAQAAPKLPTEAEVNAACQSAEKAIQAILLQLDYDTRHTIDAVNVDTRTFGNYRVDIVLK